MKIKVLFRVLGEIKFYKKTFKEYRDSLAQGKYKMFPCMRAIVLDEDKHLQIANKYFERMSAQKKFQPFVKVVNMVGLLNNRKKGDEFHAMYISNNYDLKREVKLFSFSNKKILTVCTNEKEYCNQMETYDRLKDTYKMPCVNKNERYGNSYEISMIDLLERPDELSALKEIAYSTINAFKCDDQRFTSVSSVLAFDYEDAHMTEVLNELISKIDLNEIEENIAVCVQHGDLSKDNLVYGQCDNTSGYWWIDWEHIEHRIFTYDYFFYILNSAVCLNDKTPFEYFISGKSDEFLKDLFERFGHAFKEEKRKDYFLLFSVCFLKERVCSLGSVRALDNYYVFLRDNVLTTIE